jgi:transposase
MIKYTIKLTQAEVEELHKVINKGKHTSQSYKAAYILLNVDKGEFSLGKSTNEEIRKILKVGMRTIDRVKKKCVEEGVEKALEREKSTRVYEKKVDGDLEAKIISIACSTPPKGFARWSLRMIADKAVELHYVDKLSHVSVYEVLKKTNFVPGK